MTHTRDEVVAAVERYLKVGGQAARTGEAADWATWADLFTVDADYYEHAYGHMHGREQIRAWICGALDERSCG